MVLPRGGERYFLDLEVKFLGHAPHPDDRSRTHPGGYRPAPQRRPSPMRPQAVPALERIVAGAVEGVHCRANSSLEMMFQISRSEMDARRQNEVKLVTGPGVIFFVRSWRNPQSSGATANPPPARGRHRIPATGRTAAGGVRRTTTASPGPVSASPSCRPSRQPFLSGIRPQPTRSPPAGTCRTLIPGCEQLCGTISIPQSHRLSLRDSFAPGTRRLQRSG